MKNWERPLFKGLNCFILWQIMSKTSHASKELQCSMCKNIDQHIKYVFIRNMK